MKRKRISYKNLEDRCKAINGFGKTKVSVRGTDGCGVFLSINGEVTKNMSNKKAYEKLQEILDPLMDEWLKAEGYK